MLTILVIVLVLAAAGGVAALIGLGSDTRTRVTIDTRIRASQVLGSNEETASIGPSGGTGVGGNVVVPPWGMPGPHRASMETRTTPTLGTTVPATEQASDQTGTTEATTGPATTEPSTSEPTSTEPTSTEPTTTEPTTTEPTTTEPTPTAEPSTTEPTTSQPTGTSPSGTTGTTTPTTTTGTATSTTGTATTETSTSAPPFEARPVPSDEVPDLGLPPIAEVPTEEREQLYCQTMAEPALAEAYVLRPCLAMYDEPGNDNAPSEAEAGGPGSGADPTELTDEGAGSATADDQAAGSQDAGTGRATVVPFLHQGLVDQGGRPVPAPLAAERLRARLEEVRSRPQSTPQDGPVEPPPRVREELIGIRASITVQADGLAGEPLALFWRMSAPAGVDALPGSWTTPVLASRLQPGTDSDSAALDIWIPLPQTAGPFVLDVFVVREADGALLGSQRLEPVT